GLQRLLDPVDDGGDLALRLPAAHQEHVGDDHLLGDVETDHLLGERVRGGLAGQSGQVERFFGGAHVAASVSTGRSDSRSGRAGAARSSEVNAAAAEYWPWTPVTISTVSAKGPTASGAHPRHRSGRPPA